MRKPVHLLPRGADVDDVVNITTIAVVDAQDSAVEPAWAGEGSALLARPAARRGRDLGRAHHGLRHGPVDRGHAARGQRSGLRGLVPPGRRAGRRTHRDPQPGRRRVVWRSGGRVRAVLPRRDRRRAAPHRAVADALRRRHRAAPRRGRARPQALVVLVPQGALRDLARGGKEWIVSHYLFRKP